MAKVAEVIILKAPDKVSSMNDIWGSTLALGLSSSSPGLINVGSTNFSYWTQIVAYDAQAEETNLNIFKYPPRPYDGSPYTNGYGAFSVSNPLRSFFKPDLENYAKTQSSVSNSGLYPNFWTSFIKYGIVSGFSFNPNLQVTAFQASVSGNDYLGFTFSGGVNFFEGGSNIFIQSSNQYIQGGHNVFADYGSSQSLVTTTLFTNEMGTGTPFATITDYSQNDAENTFVEAYGTNGTIDYHLFKYGYNFLIADGTMNDYVDGSTFKFLCNYPNRQDSFSCSEGSTNCFPNPKRSRVDQYETINLIVDTTIFDVDVFVYYETFDSNWNALDQIQLPLSQLGNPGCNNCGLYMFDVPIGFENMKVHFAAPNFVEYIVLWIGDDGGTPLTEYRGFYYDRQCSIYDDKHFMFQNKLGGWDFWTFYQDTKENHSFTRNEFKKEIPWGDFQTRGWGYRGKSVMSGSVNKTFLSNTNWVTETEYEYLAELIESPDVYVMEYYPQEGGFKPVPVVVTDTSYEIKTAKRDVLFNMQLNYKYAVDIPMQRQ